MNNFIESAFALEDMEMFKEYDMSSFMTNVKYSIGNRISPIANDFTCNHYTSKISEAVSLLNGIFFNPDKTNQFVSIVNSDPNIASMNIPCSVIKSNSDVSINPNYVKDYVSIIGNTINGIVNGKASKEEIMNFATDENTQKAKRQAVHISDSSNSYLYNPAELARSLDRADTTMINNDFVVKSVIPFVKQFPSLKIEMMKEASIVSSTISSSVDQLKRYKDVINGGAVSDITPDKIKQLNYFIYNSTRSAMQVMSFVTFMMLRKLNSLIDSAMSCEKIIAQVTDRPVVTEGFTDIERSLIPMDTEAISTDMVNGISSGYEQMANSIYNFHKSAYGFTYNSDTFDEIVDHYDYNHDAYDDAVKMYIFIEKCLSILSANSDDYLMVFDDIMAKSGLDISLIVRFQDDANQFDNISQYGTLNGKDQYFRMLHEIKDYPENMNKLAKTVHQIHEVTEELAKKFDDNVNGEFKNSEAFNQIKAYMSDFDDQYKKLTNLVSSKFMNRLNELNSKVMECKKDLYNANSAVSVTVPEVDTDFTEGVFDCVFECYDIMMDAIFQEMQTDFIIQHKANRRGTNVFLEGNVNQDGNNQNPTNAGSNPPASNNNQNNTNGNQNNNGTNQNSNKPEVVDNNAQNQNGNNNQSNSQSIGQLIERITNWFKEKISKFSNTIKNNKGLKDVIQYADKLISRSYSNVTINKVFPYYEWINYKTIVENDVNSIIANMKGLKPQDVSNKEDVQKKLLTFIEFKDGTSVNDSIQNHMLYNGKGSAEGSISISNGQITDAVKSMIAELQFYNGENRISDICNKISKDTSDVIKALDSLQYTEGGITKDTMNTALVSTVEIYTGSIMNVMRTRSQHYTAILSQLITKDMRNGGDNNQQNNQNAAANGETNTGNNGTPTNTEGNNNNQ